VRRRRVKLKPGRWLGYSADTDDDKARESAARRLGCAVEDVEIVRDAIVKVRRKDARDTDLPDGE